MQMNSLKIQVEPYSIVSYRSIYLHVNQKLIMLCGMRHAAVFLLRYEDVSFWYLHVQYHKCATRRQ